LQTVGGAAHNQPAVRFPRLGRGRRDVDSTRRSCVGSWPAAGFGEPSGVPGSRPLRSARSNSRWWPPRFTRLLRCPGTQLRRLLHSQARRGSVAGQRGQPVRAHRRHHAASARGTTRADDAERASVSAEPGDCWSTAAPQPDLPTGGLPSGVPTLAVRLQRTGPASRDRDACLGLLGGSGLSLARWPDPAETLCRAGRSWTINPIWITVVYYRVQPAPRRWASALSLPAAVAVALLRRPSRDWYASVPSGPSGLDAGQTSVCSIRPALQRARVQAGRRRYGRRDLGGLPPAGLTSSRLLVVHSDVSGDHDGHVSCACCPPPPCSAILPLAAG